MTTTPQELISRYGIVSDQVEPRELAVVLEKLTQSLKNNGAIVEFGCYVGTTSLYIRRILDLFHDTREFHVYDSFEGLPEKRAQDQSPVGEQFRAGELSASKKQFLREFQKANIKPPIIHKGWFESLSSDDVPNDVCFAFLDGDYYDSIKWPLHLLESKLLPGAIIVVDDYMNEALPGARRAVDEWVSRHGYQLQPVHSLAVIKLP